MEERLLLKDLEGVNDRSGRWKIIKEEMKRVSLIGGPMIGVILSQNMFQVISISVVGHLGELFLSSTALAFSLAGVTGFSLLVTPSIPPFV